MYGFTQIFNKRCTYHVQIGVVLPHDRPSPARHTRRSLEPGEISDDTTDSSSDSARQYSLLK